MIYFISLVITLGVAAAESVSYLGFFTKHTGISAYLIYLLSFVIVVYTSKPKKWLINMLGIAAVIYSIILLFLSFAEIAHYPNYVYTISHVNLVSFQFLIGILFIHYFAYKDDKLSRLERIARGLLIAILVCIGIEGFGRTTSFVRNSIEPIRQYPFASYDQKMIRSYPELYPALKEVVRLTPPDSTIIIPPQGNPWEFEGNGAIVTYFVYPRHVINMSEASAVPKVSGSSFILIAKGSWPTLTNPLGFGWPKIKIESQKIYDIDIINHKTTEYNRNYDPDLDKWDWGLIEVPHE